MEEWDFTKAAQLQDHRSGRREIQTHQICHVFARCRGEDGEVAKAGPGHPDHARGQEGISHEKFHSARRDLDGPALCRRLSPPWRPTRDPDVSFIAISAFARLRGPIHRQTAFLDFGCFVEAVVDLAGVYQTVALAAAERDAVPLPLLALPQPLEYVLSRTFKTPRFQAEPADLDERLSSFDLEAFAILYVVRSRDDLLELGLSLEVGQLPNVAAVQIGEAEGY